MNKTIRNLVATSIITATVVLSVYFARLPWVPPALKDDYRMELTDRIDLTNGTLIQSMEFTNWVIYSTNPLVFLKTNLDPAFVTISHGASGNHEVFSWNGSKDPYIVNVNNTNVVIQSDLSLTPLISLSTGSKTNLHWVVRFHQSPSLMKWPEPPEPPGPRLCCESWTNSPSAFKRHWATNLYFIQESNRFKVRYLKDGVMRRFWTGDEGYRTIEDLKAGFDLSIDFRVQMSIYDATQ